jgi:hypothetical protein
VLEAGGTWGGGSRVDEGRLTETAGLGAEKRRREVWRGARGSFRVFGLAARRASVSADGSSSYGFGVSFRVSSLTKYYPYWLGAPALPLAVASAVRFFLAGPR